MISIQTTRFGLVEIVPEDILTFPEGIPGLEDCRTWVLLADGENTALGWLQSSTHPEIALPVVSPRRFVPGYQFRVYRGELAPLELQRIEQAQVLAVVGKQDGAVTLNLKAPIVINLESRVGKQVLANGDLPLHFSLNGSSREKKIA